ncbi:septal ring factor [Sporocytophaga myxococcoides]|uniref:Septal ring factor n=1 Tax=Sporocytophaga myxococcoides TaxID=153721 RepID=A0A098L9U2_9BACT|nr:M23 family metallopeptidase [Sporocytophaga myxococcoides]GAL83715.1 septal ring factor [Sporocytophaga myxococcoides]
MLNKKIIALSAKVDSLTTEMEQKAAFTDLIQRVISGKDEEIKSESSTSVKVVKVDEINQLSIVDSLFRKEFEKKESNVFSVKNVSFGKLSNLILFNPVSGLVKSKYNAVNQSYEVGLLVKQGESVKAVANGTVIFAGWTDRNENVIILQHEDNLMTVYKKNSVVLKKDGDAVKAGEVLGVVSDPQIGGNPNFYFELWYKGKPVNPENFITF